MTAMHRTEKKVIIYGSCVARDTYEYMNHENLSLARYIARQSLISANSRPTHIESSWLQSLDSEFQQRTLRGDFGSSLFGEIEANSAEGGLLLWDLTDERMGVWQLGGDRYVTRTIELIKSGLDAHYRSRAELIPFGSDQHFELWSAALNPFKLALRGSGFLSQPILLAPPFAKRCTSRAKMSEKQLSQIRDHNHYAQRYIAEARCFGAKVITGRARPAAAADNRWGRAPYHYSRQDYLKLAKSVHLAISGTRRWQRS